MAERLTKGALRVSWLPLAFALACNGGNGSECGPGTTRVDGVCLPDITSCAPGTTNVGGECVPDIAACAMGTLLDNGTCILDGATGGCGPGTLKVGDACVPVTELQGFEVTVAPSGCPTQVSEWVPADVTIRALGPDGSTLSDYAGTVRLVGLGGILAVAPDVTGFSGGTATTQATLVGVSSSAAVAAVDIGDGRAGASAEFATVAEAFTVAIASAPTGAHTDSPFDVTFDITSNACRTPVITDEAFSVAVGDGAMAAVTGPASLTGGATATATVSVSGVSGTPIMVPLDFTFLGNVVRATVSVAPAPSFGGIGWGHGGPQGTGYLYWSAATGGNGVFSYVVYVGDSPTTIDYTTPVATTSALSAMVSGLPMAGAYVAVRARDDLDEESNTRSIFVAPSDVIFVDGSVGGPGAGTAGDPFDTLAAALGARTTETSIWVAQGIYTEIPLSVPAGVALVGGWVRDSGDPTPAGWTRATADQSTLDASMDAGIDAVTLGEGSTFAGFEIDPTVLAAGAMLLASGLTAVDIHDVDVSHIDAAGIEITSTADARLSRVVVNGVNSLLQCLRVDGSGLTADNLELIDCPDAGANNSALYATGSTITLGSGTRIENSQEHCIWIDSGELVANGITLDTCGNYGIRLDDADALAISSSRIENVVRGIAAFDSTGDLSVQGTTFEDCAVYGVSVETPSGDVRVTESRFHENTVTTGTEAAVDVISTQTAGDFYINRNFVRSFDRGVSLVSNNPTFVGDTEVEILNNDVEAASEGVRLGSQLVGSGSVDVTMSDNLLSGPDTASYTVSLVVGGPTPTVLVSNNMLQGATSNVGLSVSLGNTTADGSFTVEGNTVTGSQEALTLTVITEVGALTGAVRGNILTDSPTGLLTSLSSTSGVLDVDYETNTIRSVSTGIALTTFVAGDAARAQIDGNIITDASVTGIDADASGPAEISVRNNQSYGGTRAVRVQAPSAPDVLTAHIEDNVFSARGGIFINELDRTGSVDISIVRNRISHPALPCVSFAAPADSNLVVAANRCIGDTPVEVEVLAAGVEGDFTNNVFVAHTNGASTDHNLEFNFDAAVPDAVLIAHNTIVGSLNDGVRTFGQTGAPVTVTSNIIVEYTDLPFSSFHPAGVPPTTAYNLVGVGAGAAGTDFEATPSFVLRPSNILVGTSYNGGAGTFEVNDGGLLAVGDAVLLDLEDTERMVTAINANTITVDGPPLGYSPGSGDVMVLHYASGSVAGRPDYRLQAGSPGVDAADPSFPTDPDGSAPDVGAYGGPGAADLSAPL